jgi:hypothetical protein
LLQRRKKCNHLIRPTIFQVCRDHLDIVEMIEDEAQKKAIINPPSRAVQ